MTAYMSGHAVGNDRRRFHKCYRLRCMCDGDMRANDGQYERNESTNDGPIGLYMQLYATTSV